MVTIYFKLADGEVAVTPKNGKWTAAELKSHIEIANIGEHHAERDGEEMVVLDQNRKVVVRADEEATKQIVEDMTNQLRKVLAEKLGCGEQAIEIPDLDINWFNACVKLADLD